MVEKDSSNGNDVWKMAAVDSSGQLTECRYTSGGVPAGTRLSAGLWESATVGGAYSVQDLTCSTSPQADQSSMQARPTCNCPSTVNQIRDQPQGVYCAYDTTAAQADAKVF